ncbi:MAG: hypothetical protein KF830_02355 [Planctomycetes bacterium]|nr:hypothetical protein [Planctomycetota bacterium]
MPLGYTTRNAPDIAVKLAGFTPDAPTDFPTGVPRPDFAALVGAITPATLRRPVPVLAMTLGMDVLAIGEVELDATDFPGEQPPLGTGGSRYPLLQVGDHGWYAILFSVDTDQLGPSPDVAPAIAAAGADADRSLFAYVLPTSAVAWLPEEDQSRLALPPTALGLTDRDDALVALNLHMALYATDLARYPDVFTTRPLPARPTVYFTIDDRSLTADECKALAAAWGLGRIDSVTIYATEWTDAGWQRLPSVYATAAQLGLDLPDGAAIDGLALDTKGSGATGQPHELLFSLRGADGHVVEAPHQIQYVRPGDPPPAPPRPVVIRRRDGRYGSLGREARGGRGIGDFCTADPWVATGQRAEWYRADPLLDDFLIARRLPPDEAHLLPTGSGMRLAGWVPRQMLQRPFGGLVRADLAQAEASLPSLPSLLVQHAGGGFRVPELRLGIAAYRHSERARSMMRACLAGPLPTPVAGPARLRWGRMKDYTVPVGDPGNVAWLGEFEFAYAGTPVTRDVELPTDGVLPPRSGSTSGSGAPSAAVPDPAHRCAYVMQWQMEANGSSYVSPIAALRF